MGKHHDIGHTFLGHSGEWWISNILEDYGLGNFCHNTLGASQLIYTNNIYDEIIEKIKTYNPKVTPKQLEKIRSSLWLIMDAINGHNGEKPEKEFIPQSQKTQEGFDNEMIKCYCVKGYDKKIMPATPEACLMRLADKISYIPFDMVDGIGEGLVRDEEGNIIDYLDKDYEAILTQIGITKEQIEKANIKKDYGEIVEKLREIFIKDVIQNSTKKKIKMSAEMTIKMGELLDLNNAKAVNNVVLIEDQKTYPPAIRTLINQYKNIIVENHLTTKLENASNDMTIHEGLELYQGTPYEKFITYICNMNPEDYKFIVHMVEEATKQSIKDELTIARECVQDRKPYKQKQELGYDYGRKNARVKAYTQYYKTQLEEGKLVGYNEESLEKEVERIMQNIKDGKQNKNYLSYEESIAMMIGAKYIATLDDMEFIQLLQETYLINEEQYKSLTRKYKDIEDLKSEAYSSSNWKEISGMQKEATKNAKKEMQI